MGVKKNTSSGKITFNVTKKAKDNFYHAKNDYLAKNTNLTNDEFINYLLTLIKSDNIMHNYSKDIQEISQIQNLPVARVCEEALITYIKKIKKANKKGLVNNAKTVKSDNLINEVIKAMISHNSKNEHLHRIFINQTSIARFAADAEKMQSINLKPHKFAKSVIVRGLKNNVDIINKHHEEYKLNSSHNVKAYAAKRFTSKNEVVNVAKKEKLRRM